MRALVRDPRAASRLADAGVELARGHGRSTFSLVHASAVADGAVSAARCSAAGGRAFNLANDFPVSVADLVQFPANGLGRRVRGVPITSEQARRELGWSPTVRPPAGIPEAFAWGREQSA